MRGLMRVVDQRRRSLRRRSTSRRRDYGPGAVRSRGEGGVRIHRILCPSDFSDASAHAVDQAIRLAETYRAKIIALHAVSPLTSAVPLAQATANPGRRFWMLSATSTA